MGSINGLLKKTEPGIVFVCLVISMNNKHCSVSVEGYMAVESAGGAIREVHFVCVEDWRLLYSLNTPSSTHPSP